MSSPAEPAKANSDLNEKLIKLKSLQMELALALSEAKEYTGKTEADAQTFNKIERLLNEMAALTAPEKK